MKLLVGLGNPGAQYQATRHNIGFCILDALSRKWGVDFGKSQFDSQMAKAVFKNEEVILAKPQTFMNLSGEAVAKIVHFYKVEIKDCLVIHDELDFPLGVLRFSKGGGTGGHNGLKSVAGVLGQDGFPRLRVGIGKPPHKGQVTSYVLSAFDDDETELVELVVELSVQALEVFLESGIEGAMNKYHGLVIE